MTNTKAYYAMELITAIKSILQVPVACNIILVTAAIDSVLQKARVFVTTTVA